MAATRGAAVVVLVTSGLLLAPASARADSEDQAAAETLFKDARDLLRAGQVDEACRKFSESYRLDHAAGTLLNLALCHEKQGKVASAWVEYTQSVALARQAGNASREQVASEAAAALEPRLPRLTVTVPDEARLKGLEVIRNQSAIEQGGWGTPLPVDPGDVLIEAHAPGYKPWSTRITLQAGEAKSVAIPVLALDEQTLAASKPSWWTASRRTGAILGAAGVASIAVGSYFGVEALQTKQQAMTQCPSRDGEVRCNTSGSSLSKTAVEQAWVSDITIGVGVAAVVAAVVLVVTGKPNTTAPSDVSPRPLAARIDLAWIGRGGAGLRLDW
jgi:hypothetical protein